MGVLAINGGKPTAELKLHQKFYGKSEMKERMNSLIYSEYFSGYRGSWRDAFWGGENVKELEKFFSEYLGGDNKALAVNSCTSALIVACGAIGLKPGDEVIVTPWSMSCSATAPMIYGATPVFADIDPQTFCLDPDDVKKKITPRTKAIIVVDLFGHMYDQRINEIAVEYDLFVIEDAAQAIGAKYDGEDGFAHAGTIGDIGCFSFTQGKHFTSGEGGFIVTSNPTLYMKCALIRNHAEAVISSAPKNESFFDYENLVGMNLRMTEFQAVVLLEQLKHIDEEIARRNHIVNVFRNSLAIPNMSLSATKNNFLHAYYVLAFFYLEEGDAPKREKFIEAVNAEIKIKESMMSMQSEFCRCGYIDPLYKMPVFKYRNIEPLEIVENYQKDEFCLTLFQKYEINDAEVRLIASAFNKVWENRKELV